MSENEKTNKEIVKSNKKKKKFSTLTLTQLALFTAIIIIMTFVPYTGIISYGIISITTLHIPVIIGSILLGWKSGAILGFIMGICSLIRAWVMPGSALEQIIFTNPLVSVLPRIFIGVFSALVFAWLYKLTKGKQVISIGIAALIGTLTNTVLVITMMNLIYYEKLSSSFGGTLRTIVSTIFGINGLIEIAAAIVVSIPVCIALFKATKRIRE